MFAQRFLFMGRGDKRTLNKLRSSYVTTIISITLVLLLLGIIGFLGLNTKCISDYVKENIGFTIMLKDGVNEIETLKFQKILDASDFAKSTSFTTKEQARERQ